MRNSPFTTKIFQFQLNQTKPGKKLKNFLFFNYFLQNGRQLKYSFVTGILYE